MKALDTALFATTLLLVPALAWLVGRFMGKRDWGIVSVILIAGLIALMPHAARFALLAQADTGPFTEAVLHRLTLALQFPEVGLFFLALAVFMTMLGWTSTPVLVHKA